MDGYAEIESSNNTQCVIKKLQEAATVVNGTLTAAVKKKYNNGSLFSKTFAIEFVNDTIAETDTGIVTALYNAGLCANSTYITKEEAALITDVDLQPGTSSSTSVFYNQAKNIKSFDGFQYFTSVTSVPQNLFGSDTYYGNFYPSLTSITIPPTVTTLGKKCFCNTASLKSIKGGESVTSIGQYAFYGCTNVTTFELPNFGYVKAMASPNSLVPKSFYVRRYYLNGTVFDNGTDIGIMIVDAAVSYVTLQKNCSFGDVEEISYDTPLGQVTTLYLPDIIYYAVYVNTNMANATSFKISYTSTITGLVKESIINANVATMLDVALGYSVTTSSITEIEGYYCSDNTTTPSTTGSIPFSVTMTYKLLLDLYIQHVDGTLYTQEEWEQGGFSNDQANGVAVVTSETSFVIAKTLQTGITFDLYGSTISDVVITTDEKKAALDFKGLLNTEKIKNSSAVSYCKNYLFPNGKNGYLGAAGEWLIIGHNKSAINTLLLLIGGVSLFSPSGTYWWWTSTQYNSYSMWVLRGDINTLSSYTKSNSNVVRAFQSIGSLTIASNRSAAQFSVTYTNLWGVTKNDILGVGLHNLFIKQGTEVNIVPLPLPDGLEVEGKTFIYGLDQDEQTFNYAIGDGVYIQHINKTLYTQEEWEQGGFSNDQANGVAVVALDNFVIAKDDASSSTLKWGGYNKTLTGVSLAKSLAAALLDFDGMGNTQKIIEQLSGSIDSLNVVGAPAAETCVNYTFPNGKNGHLPSMGELYAACNNKAMVDSALTLIGGTAIESTYYWTSTPTNDDSVWFINAGTKGASNTGKNMSYRVRAFQSF